MTQSSADATINISTGEPAIGRILDELAHWHLRYEHATDPDACTSPGAMEAAALSTRPGELLSVLSRPVRLG